MKNCPGFSSTFTIFYASLFCFIHLISCKKENTTIVSDDAVAYAFPVAEISLDGDLSDWPDDMVRYPIKNAAIGDAPDGNSDYEGHFRIGYGPNGNTVFIAMEISDQSVFIDTTQNSNWNTQDGLELYLNPKNEHSGSPVTQYVEYGETRNVFGAGDNWDNVEMKKRTTAKGKTVEWKITLDHEIQTGMSMGLDLVAIDKDQDNSFTWVSWGKGTQKIANPDRLGNVLFVAPGTVLRTAKGQADLSGLEQRPSSLTARITSVDNPKMWVRASIDSMGNYSTTLPIGKYQVDYPNRLMEVDYRFHRMNPIDPIEFDLKENGKHILPTLTPKFRDKPYVLPKKGLLHDFGSGEEKKVDEYVQACQEFYNIPGVSLALIKDGKVVYHKTYGVKNTVTQEPVDGKTLFEAASITKPVFAYVALRLADKGILDLDEPLHEYLPFEALQEYPEYKKMTGRHVLIHRSGLPNWGAEMINTPGEKYGYSGEGFEYLKRVVVEITGKPIEQILDEELISPNKLYHMEFSDNEELRKVVSSGHMNNNPTNWDIPQEAGMAFSMHTEAKAFSKYAIALLERKGLKSSTYKEFMTIHTESDSEYWNLPDKREGAGLGIFIRETEYGNTFYHGGNNGDFKCLFEVYDDLKMGYIVYTNSNTGSELTFDLWQLLVEGKIDKR